MKAIVMQYPPRPSRRRCWFGAVEYLTGGIAIAFQPVSGAKLTPKSPAAARRPPDGRRTVSTLRAHFHEKCGSGGVLAMAIFEAGILLQKRQRHVAGRPVALFSDDKLGLAGFFLLSLVVGLVELGAYQ